MKNEQKGKKILASASFRCFDSLALIAAKICHSGQCFIIGLDGDRSLCLGQYGTKVDRPLVDEVERSPLSDKNEIFFVEDISLDKNPVTSIFPHIKFFAYLPVFLTNDHKIAYLCITDSKKRSLSRHQIESLEEISKHLVEALRLQDNNTSLRKLKNQYEDVQSMAQTGGWELDLRTSKTTWSKEVYRIHGVSEDLSFDRIDAISFFAEHERERLESVINDCIEHGKKFDEEFEFYSKDGSKKWVRSIGRPFIDRHGEVTKLVGTFQDITEQRLIRDKMQEKNFEIEAYAKGLNKYAIVAKTDSSGRITYANDLFCEISGYSREEILGRNHRILNSGEHSKDFFKNLWTTVKSGDVWRGDIKNKSKDGNFYWVDTTISPSFDSDGKVSELIAFRYDITRKKENEELLIESISETRKNLNFSRAIRDNAHHAMISTNLEGVITSFNKSAEEMLGYSESELVGKESLAIFHDINEVIERASEFSRTLNENITPGFQVFTCHTDKGLNNQFEWTYIRKNGGGLTVLLSVTPLVDCDGVVTGYLGSAQDISEIKKTEERLIRLASEQEAVNKLLKISNSDIKGLPLKVENALDVLLEVPWLNFLSTVQVFTLDQSKDLRILASKNLDRSEKNECTDEQKSFILQSFGECDEVIHIKCKDHDHYNIPVLGSEKNTVAIIVLFLPKDFERKNLEIDFLRSCGDIIGNIISSQSARDELISSRNTLDLALEGCGLGVWDWNLVDDSVIFDERWAKMLGLNHNEILMDIETWKVRVHPDDIEGCYKDIENYMSGKTSVYENIHRTKHADGHWLYILGKGRFSDWDDNGKPTRFTGTNLDITEKIEMEHALSRNTKLASIGQLAAGVGHEINNPLAIIKGYITAAVRKHPDMPNELKNIFHKIDTASGKIANIVKGLRTFARAEETLTDELFAPKSILEEMENMLKEIYGQERVQLFFDLNEMPKDLYIKGSRGRFEQVMMNLITNAKDATEKSSKREIRVEASFDGETELSLIVTDSGEGVTDEFRDKIFDPFFTTKDVGKGTGIGLSLVHKFVKNDFKGDIKLLQNRPDEGASFELSLPVIVQSAVSKTVEKKEETESLVHLGIKAIIVDDEIELRDLLADLFTESGIGVSVFSNGCEALEEVQRNPGKYDLIVSDMQMPEIDGPTLLRAVRAMEEAQPVKFFFITGGININFEDEDSELNSLIDGYFYKPFDEGEILAKISGIFKKSKKQNAA